MRKTTITVMTLAVLAVSLLIQGCEQPNIVPDLPGTTVKFKAATTWDNGIKTKTVYSGEIIGTTDKKERIDWLAGDKIRIYSDKASFYYDASVHYADYSVDAGSISSEGASSFATITPAGDLDGEATNASSANGLVWGDGTHKFFSVYPSPAVTDENLELYGSGTDYRTFRAIIPNEVVFKVSDVVDGVLKPDMNYAYMYAMAQAEPGNAVTLKYQPMFTAFQFTLDSGDDDELTFLDFYIKSEVDDLTEVPAGHYKATLTMPDDPEQAKISYSFGTAGDDTQKRIHVKFGENGEGITITKGHPLTFTVLARPVDYTKLTIIVATLNTDGTRTKKLELKDASDKWVSFPGGHKFNFKFGVPGEWIYYIDDPEPVTLTYEGGEAALHVSNQFKSYRTRSGQSEPVDYKLQYSTYNDETGTWSGWNDGLPAWLGATSPSSYAGSVSGEALKLEMDHQDNTAVDPHRDEYLIKDEHSKTDFDLSTINVATDNWDSATGTGPRTTANCYVVQGYGTYKFPVVYGNGVTDGAVNPSAYTGTPIPDEHAMDKPFFLEAFKDDNNDDIDDSPYIVVHKGISIDDVTPVLVWMDEKDLVTNLGTDGSGETAYITFTVPKENIRQGNAVIALKKKSDDTILWSWHIWVTDHDLTQSVKSPTGYSIAQYNLGWCDGRELEKYLERKCRIRAVQLDENGDEFRTQDHESAPAIVLQQAYKTIVRDNNPYYQWGRKDPQRASDGLAIGGNLLFGYKKLAYINDDYPIGERIISTDPGTSIGSSIQQPHLYYYAKLPNHKDWNDSHSYFNLWNSRLTTTDAYGSAGVFVTKTIYDPSPVGFKVGPTGAFNGFTRMSFHLVDETELTELEIVRLDFGSGLSFPLMGNRSVSATSTDSHPMSIDILGPYWTASVREPQVGVHLLIFSRANFIIDDTNSRPMGSSIRPVVDDDFSKGFQAPGENVIWD